MDNGEMTFTKDDPVLVPYSQNPDFVARSDILNNVKEQFGLGQHKGPVQSRRRVSLYGLGGVGYAVIFLLQCMFIL